MKTTDARWQRLTGWMGIMVALLLTASGMLGSGMRQYDASAATTINYFTHHSGRVLTVLDLQLINLVPFLLFVVGLRTILTRIDVEPAALSTLACVAGLVLVPVLLVWHAMPAATALASQAGDVGSVRTLLHLGGVLDDFATVPTGIFVGAASIVMLRGAYRPRWLPWFGLLAGVLSFVGSLDVLHPDGIISGVGHIGFLGFALWLLATGISLIRTSPVPQRLQSQSPAETVRAV